MTQQTAIQTRPQVQTIPAPTSGILQRQCACGNHTVAGGECAECAKKKHGLQRKLAIGASNDPLEREAERVAEQVMAASIHPVASNTPPRIQRYAGQAAEGIDTAPASVDRVLAGSGRPLEPALRQDMEQRFGHDFSRVRVHSDGAAEQSAREMNANAYTVGHNIVFGAGRFAPGTHGGQRLIAHELTHVVQQSGSDEIRASQGGEKRGLSPIPESNGKWSIPYRPHPFDRNGLLLRQPSSGSVRTGVTFVTEFHPGIAHNHAPTGRWADIQKDAESRCKKFTADLESEVSKGDKADPKKIATTGGLASIECSCANLPPEYVLKTAGITVMLGLPLAQKHLDYYITGGGVNFIEDMEDILRRDSKVRSKLASAMKKSNRGNIRVEQSDYAVKDFQYAFGAIDRLDFEVNKKTGLVHVWFMDRYEWHPVGFGYKSLAGDSRRETNCVHAAAVELKASGAADYWMLGDAVIPLSLITGGGAP